MARPKGSRNKKTLEREAAAARGEPIEVVADAPPVIGPGDNAKKDDAVTQTLALQWLDKYKRDLAAKKAADNVLKETGKKVKAELGEGGLDLLKDMLALETEEGEKQLKARVERMQRASRYMAAVLGWQFELFEEGVPAEERAAAEGQRDGMRGVPHSRDYHPGTPQYDAYMRSYAAGNAVLMNTEAPLLHAAE